MAKKEPVIIAGLEEAGRGAVIGPLVVAGVAVPLKDVHKLKRLGVRDSKELASGRREKLAEKIENIANIVVLKVGPCKIDNYRKQGINLNRIEAMKFAEIIGLLNPHKAYIDCPDVNHSKFGLFMKKMVGDEVELFVEHKAENKYPVVAAASIIAKVERDSEIEKLKKKYGDFGPGYPSNSVTMKWLREWLEKNRDFPEGVVRKSWITSGMVKGEREQKNIMSFFRKIAGR